VGVTPTHFAQDFASLKNGAGLVLSSTPLQPLASSRAEKETRVLGDSVASTANMGEEGGADTLALAGEQRNRKTH